MLYAIRNFNGWVCTNSNDIIIFMKRFNNGMTYAIVTAAAIGVLSDDIKNFYTGLAIVIFIGSIGFVIGFNRK